MYIKLLDMKNKMPRHPRILVQDVPWGHPGLKLNHYVLSVHPSKERPYFLTNVDPIL